MHELFFGSRLNSLGELIGWIGRASSSHCPYSTVLFEMQLATLIIGTTALLLLEAETKLIVVAPNFFTAGCYVILGRLIDRLGRQYSLISSKLYLYIFCGCDVISLVIQAIGGGRAAAAFNTVNGDTKPGTDTMVAGIIFQLASITVFACFFALVLWKARGKLHGTKSNRDFLIIAATGFSITLIYIRSIYRTIELLQGWRGYLITRERYFIALDGTMMLLAVAIFNVVNPGVWLTTPTVDSTRQADGLEFDSPPVTIEQGIQRGKA